MSENAIPGWSPGSRLLADLRPYVRQCGCERRHAWHIGPRKLLDFLLVYIEDGTGRFRIADEEFEARPGDLFWIPPGVIHEMTGFPPSMLCPYAHFDLVYRPDFSHWDFVIPEGMTELGELTGLMHPPVAEEFMALQGKPAIAHSHLVGERLHLICEQATRATPYAQLWMSAAMVEILAIMLEACESESAEAGVQYRIALERTARYMRNHCQGPQSIPVLARRTGLSTCYFRRLFRHNFGMSPHAYLMQARLNRAKDLMLHTALSLSEIAEEAGFSSIHNFSRAFTRLQGSSPSEFRRVGRTVPVQVEGRVASYCR